ncbi:MAG: hypothetical protein PHN55_11315 [Dysgonamonadaceae bacterium]|jgi:hypothetical protein|nr:hypothetical protein [Bacteroidales bacterium]MDD4729323.1 hypothetical protein [Dysgonamonadaceae bacterium]
MQDTLIIKDTIDAICCTLGCKGVLPEKSLLDNICSVASIIIAIANVVLIIFIFRHNNKKDDSDKEKTRRQHLLKTLVLDYNMSKFYSFYQEIHKETNALLANNLSNEDKSRINENIKEKAVELRQNFIDMFLAIDDNLYKMLLSKIDELIDSLTNTIFDEGINLAFKPKYDEEVSKRIRESKTAIIGVLFSYTGE